MLHSPFALYPETERAFMATPLNLYLTLLLPETLRAAGLFRLSHVSAWLHWIKVPCFKASCCCCWLVVMANSHPNIESKEEEERKGEQEGQERFIFPCLLASDADKQARAAELSQYFLNAETCEPKWESIFILFFSPSEWALNNSRDKHTHTANKILNKTNSSGMRQRKERKR